MIYILANGYAQATFVASTMKASKEQWRYIEDERVLYGTRCPVVLVTEQACYREDYAGIMQILKHHGARLWKEDDLARKAYQREPGRR